MPVRRTKRGAERTALEGSWDVVVCGASFAGLTVARELAGSGARVLIVDRYEIGERQTSACAAPTEWLQALGLADSIRQIESRQDEVLLHVAGVTLDRALFPLLVRLGGARVLSVAQLAEQAGRDPSTVSRQLAKLEQLGLVKRPTLQEDMRVRAAAITKAGARTLAAITEARRQLLAELIHDWSAEEQRLFPRLLQSLADAMKAKQDSADSGSA